MLSGPTESTATKPHHPAIKPQTERTKAEAWEKDEMAKIKERYTKLKSTILAWEEKKKKKAKTKLYRAERGLERKRARALLEFQNEMDHIKQAVDGERSQAEANQKANIITVKEGKKKKKAKDKLDRAERGLERKEHEPR
ncbi:remorin 1.4-like [Hibiscus syriacus]|uniref:remorin 1.4-like n=1 Tax=Hibiscus syriacus TaxID=106335 RepID=UPI001924E599|nr:remorin 1.4-like [Hibiscus syriacus]